MHHQAPSASGEYPVILFAVSVASAYVVTPGKKDYPADHGFSKFYSADSSCSVALMPNYNAHFVPVKHCGRTHCVTGLKVPHDTDFQAAVEGKDASERLSQSGSCAIIDTHALLLQLRTSWWLFRTNRHCLLRWCGCEKILLIHDHVHVYIFFSQRAVMQLDNKHYVNRLHLFFDVSHELLRHAAPRPGLSSSWSYVLHMWCECC